MANSTPKSHHTDPQLYLYTSLTSGSSQIVTATSRLQTILKANKIPFQALDVATDEKARMLWGRRAGKRKLPGLVRMGVILGDLEQVEEWNEYGEIKENLGSFPSASSTSTPTLSNTNTPSKIPESSASIILPSTPTKALANSTISPSQSSAEKPAAELPKSDAATDMTSTMRQLGLEAAKKAGEAKSKARIEAMEAAKAKNPELQKLDYSGPKNMPPPSGTTKGADAVSAETGRTTVEGRADQVSATVEKEAKGKSSEETREESEKQAPKRESVDTSSAELTSIVDQPTENGEKLETTIPSTKEVEESANVAMTQDNEEVLEGEGQAEPEVPTAKEVEEKANKAIIEDKSSPAVAINENIVVDPRVIPAGKDQESNTTQEHGLGPESSHDKDEDAHMAVQNSAIQSTESERRNPKANDSEGKHEEKEEGDQEEQKEVVKSVTASNEAENLPGTKTQDQPAASGEKAGESVAD